MHKYIRTFALLICAIFTYYGCAIRDTVDKNVKNTESVYEDASPYIKDFKDTMSTIFSQNYMNNVNISMADIKGTSVGLCWPGLRPKLIHIDKDWWRRASHLARENLIWHEMAHCVCKLDHSHFMGTYPNGRETPRVKKNQLLEAGFLPDGCPVSYLYPSAIEENCLQKYREFYKYDVYLQCKASQAYRKSRRL